MSHCPQSPRSSSTGLLQLRIQPAMFCIVSPSLFKRWHLGKVQTFPCQEEQKAVCFHRGWVVVFFFFFPVMFSQEAKPRQVHSERFPGLENSPLSTSASFAVGFKDASFLETRNMSSFCWTTSSDSLVSPSLSTGKRKEGKAERKKKKIKGKIQL